MVASLAHQAYACGAVLGTKELLVILIIKSLKLKFIHWQIHSKKTKRPNHNLI